MPKFKPGDLCYIMAEAQSVSYPALLAYVGGPVVEIDRFVGDAGINQDKDWYIVVATDGHVFQAREICLRRIPPKKEDLGDWDVITKEIGYKPPSRQTVGV